MSKSFRLLAAFVFTNFLTIAVLAQTTSISGNVRSTANQEVVPAVSVTLKGGTAGTFTDERGNFRLTTSQQPPFVLVFSSIGYETQEITVNNATDVIQVDFVPASSLGVEVVISASRLPERILESPVSIERMGAAQIRRTAVPNYYDAIANLKGVDLTTSSLTFRTISTRGFNGSGNLRFNQLIDGMDNQAPGLNFSVGSVIGVTELDVDNVELLQGASSALYGPGGMNGTLLITSKDPWKYQGLSFQVKQGIMHTDGRQRSAAPFYDWNLRWGKKLSEKFAFKIAAQFISAKDWEANDKRNLARNNVFSSIKDGTRETDPNYDGVNVFGDEVSASMSAFAQVAQAQTRAGVLQATNNTVDILPLLNSLPAMPTQQQLAAFIGGFPPQLQPTIQNVLPFHLGLRNDIYGGQFVSRTGYEEEFLVDYNSYNVKLTGGLYYKLTENIEASLLGYYGTGTTVYTGADRYALKNLKMGQYKLEVKSKNWFVRAYTTQENSGDSYTATTAAYAINESWRTNADWFALYTGNYSGARLMGAPNEQAHAIARAAAEQGRILPGTAAFDAAFDKAINTPIGQGGAKFADRTNLYHLEGQLNLTDYVKVVDVLVGANYRLFRLNSQGTIFADTAGRINISEYGAYVQLQKKLFGDILKLTGSVRYDKNENFDGRFTPRATALVQVAKDNNIRFSYQTAYRFPSTQDQWINLNTPGSRLIGGLPDFNTFFKFDESPAYTAASIVAYRASLATQPNPGLLQQATFQTVKPETVSSFELGYRGLVTRRLLIDAYGYLSRYNDFIARVAVGRGRSAVPAQAAIELASPFTTTNYSFVTNTDNTVKAFGYGLGVEYQIGRGFNASFNFSSDELNDVPEGLVTFFNTPKYRFNIGLGNDRLRGGNWGFNVLYRWQDEVLWQGTFGTGEIPSFGTLDAQISYRLTKARSMIKLGGSNILNKYYYSAFGNPQVGGMYYVSFGYNVF
jgi:outer membrane receptor protein involved in Fe transport